MKVIFIDIDGPLAWGTWTEGKVEITETINYPFEIPYGLVKEDCEALAKIIKVSDAYLVISSDWKKHFTLPQLKAIFYKYGIPHWSIIDTTTHFNARKKLSSSIEWDRACEIHSWVKTFKPKHWVAIDDLPLKASFKSLGVAQWRHIQVDGDWGNGGKLRDKVEEVVNKLNK